MILRNFRAAIFILLAVAQSPKSLPAQSVTPVEAVQERIEIPFEYAGGHMIAEIGARFDAVEIATCPYLYRTFAARLDAADHGESITRHLVAFEQQRIASGQLRAVGLRITARKRRVRGD